MQKTSTKDNFGFVRVAAAVPKLKVGDPEYNTGEILNWTKKADQEKVSILIFPEMSIPGYTAADLYFQRLLQNKVLENIEVLTRASKKFTPLIVVGAPIALEGKLFNTAILIHGGKILGIVPKIHIPGYKEFYEERWFSSARDLIAREIDLLGSKIPIGTDILFRLKNIPGVVLGVEICEDLWTPLPPSSLQAIHGATIIANLSASNDLVGKADYRRLLLTQQSARGVTGYVYASSGVHESTTDLVFGGHAMIAENGTLLKESKRFQREGEWIVADIDIEHLISDRERMTSFGESIHEFSRQEFRIVEVMFKQLKSSTLLRHIDPHPFVPQNPQERDLRAKEIFSIQVAGLATRLESKDISHLLLGISGGLDSTLALLVAVKTADLLGFSKKNVHAYSLPGFGTSSRTKNNARLLSKALGVSFEEIDIQKGVLQQLRDIGHDTKTDDTVYENAQARYRTYTLMDKANELRGLVVGTGDLSEIALGWNTYTGDHIAHYNVNCTIPKTLVKYLIGWVAETQVDKKTRAVLEDILITPISPELKKSIKGEISQKTEDIIGPYELHDFFLYHFLRWGSSPKKIFFLAKLAWRNKYTEGELKKWLKVFIKRFFENQWKRSVATDGPKVGSVSLSPRGDWRMPSDAEARAWIEDAESGR